MRVIGVLAKKCRLPSLTPDLRNENLCRWDSQITFSILGSSHGY